MRHPSLTLQMPPQMLVRKSGASINFDKGCIGEAGDDPALDAGHLADIRAAAGQSGLVGDSNLGRAEVLGSLRIEEVPASGVLEDVHYDGKAAIIRRVDGVSIVGGFRSSIRMPVEQA
jgi:hypothetical protein